MSRYGERKKLSELALSLIKEYEELSTEFRDGIENIEIDETYENIRITNDYGEESFSLDEISQYYFEEQHRGELTNVIRERLDFTEIRNKFNSMDKNEFISYIGSLYYINYRCSEIYGELKAIEEYYEENLI